MERNLVMIMGDLKDYWKGCSRVCKSDYMRAKKLDILKVYLTAVNLVQLLDP